MSTNFGFICQDPHGPYQNGPKKAIKGLKYDAKGVKIKGGSSAYAFDTLPADDTLPKAGSYDYITFFGSHGDCDDNGAPTELNGLKGAKAKQLVEKLQAAKVTAKNFVLDCCVTASFIPMFIPILTKGGPEMNIICFWGNAPGMISSNLDGEKTLAGAVCKVIHACEEFEQALATPLVMPVGIYTHANKTFYRKKHADLPAAEQGSISVMMAKQGDFDCVPGMEKALKKAGVTIADVSTKELETKIRTTVSVLSHSS